MSRAEEIKRTMKRDRILRFAVQICFFILAPSAFSAGFNGAKYIFTQLGLGEPIAMTSFVALLVALLILTIVFGRFFCGFACAFGTLGDVFFAVFDLLRSKTSIPRLDMPAGLVKVLSKVKYAVLAAILVTCFFGVWSAVSGWSPWVSFAGLIGGSLDGISVAAYVTLALVVILMIVRERAFCQFLCPLGAIFTLLPVLPFSRFKRRRDRCLRNCGRCEQHCPASIWPDDGMTSQGECFACARCAGVCPISNVSLVLPNESAPESGSNHGEAATKEADKRGLRGNEPWLVIMKAVILLAVFWILGATRYLPTIW